MAVIQFVDVTGVIPEDKYPAPATDFMPKWYREQAARINAADPDTAVTIKKCTPVFDAINTGYIIPLPFDIEVRTVDGEPGYKFFAQTMQFHPVEQAPTHPEGNGYAFPKWMSPWSIRTEPGWSCLFLPPMHHDLPFRTLEGVVDTDNYIVPVNLPFVLKDPKWEGIIYAGCPLVQVVPIKREPWKLETSVSSKDMAVHEAEKKTRAFGKNSYKSQFWEKKIYK